jgi:DNA polymerase III subunit epsilon
LESKTLLPETTLPETTLHSPLSSAKLLAHYRKLSQFPLTVVDVETTGGSAQASRIIEISVLQASLEDGILFQKTDLIDPGIPVPADITRFTGITSAMVSTAPAAAEVMPLYWDPLSSHVLTAHNLVFDYGFLKAEYQRLGQVFERPSSQQLCTVKLARLMLADLPSRRLGDLVRHFGFSVGRSHRAEADTMACWLVAQRLLSELNSEDDETLIKRLGYQWLYLSDAATLMNCTPDRARQILEARGVNPRSSRNRTNPSYRRTDVENLCSIDNFNAETQS